VAFSFHPTFTLDVAAAGAEVLGQLQRRLAGTRFVVRRTRPPGGGPDHAARDHDHVILTVPATERHFWSPWLTLEVAAGPDAGTRITGSFSPHPSVWTGYLLGYLGLGLVCLFGVLYAAALAISDSDGSPWTLWVAAGAVAGMLAMWAGSIVGQRLARAQMAELRTALDQALG
jgi:hypothetical protein